METSYFGKASKLEGRRLVSISRTTPPWFQGERLEILAPSWNLILLARQNKFEEYIERYKEENLARVNPKQLQRLYHNAVFMCYEKAPPYYERYSYMNSDYFCHRHVLSQWLREHGIPCEELYLGQGVFI